MRIRWNGEDIEVPDGVTVAAAGLAAGRLILQRSRSLREPRGYFCGVGRCFSCAATIDGVGRSLACRVRVREGMRVETLDGDPLPPTAAPTDAAVSDLTDGDWDVLVVGGGPAGRAALRAASAHGARVLGLSQAEAPPPGFRRASAWGVFDGGRQWTALAGGRTVALRARSAVLCAGASEVGEPFPGWTRPGVMTATAARLLLAQGIPPGSRPVLHGEAPYVRAMAGELDRLGLPHVEAAVAAASGGERVDAVTLADGRRLEADAVILCTPPQPHLELAQAAGAAIFWDGVLRSHAVAHDRSLCTSLAGLFVAGGVAGACTARQAELHGEIAGRAAATGQAPDAGDWGPVLAEARSAGIEPLEPRAWAAPLAEDQWRRDQG